MNKKKETGEMYDVMIVDDDPNIITALGFVLGKENFRYLAATDGEAALALIRQHRPPIVFLDIMLPGLDGYEVCERIKQDPELSSTHVVLISAKGQTVDVNEGFRAGADGYFTKPFSPAALVERLREIRQK